MQLKQGHPKAPLRLNGIDKRLAFARTYLRDFPMVLGSSSELPLARNSHPSLVVQELHRSLPCRSLRRYKLETDGPIHLKLNPFREEIL